MTIALSLPAETYSQNGSTIKSTRDLLSKLCVKKKARFRWTSGEPAALQLISQKLFMLMSTVKEYNALWLELSGVATTMILCISNLSRLASHHLS